LPPAFATSFFDAATTSISANSIIIDIAINIAIEVATDIALTVAAAITITT
jgi:hypothetical protein